MLLQDSQHAIASEQSVVTESRRDSAAKVERASGGEEVIILDFGAQYTQLIARRVRQCGVFCEILPFDTTLEELLGRRPQGIILSGGPASVYAEGAPRCDPALFSQGIPVLGICYGMQLMAHVLGGSVGGSPLREYGATEVRVEAEGQLFRGLQGDQLVWMSHGDSVDRAPAGFRVIARTAQGYAAAMDNGKGLVGVQFHPEVVHTPAGIEVLRNFLLEVCDCSGSWNMASFVETAIEEIRETVGNERVICGVSGGVDSTVAAALIHRAIGNQLTCVFVNHGLLRKDEAEQVREALEGVLGAPLVYEDASERFLRQLAGVEEPEQKRRIIGEEFVRAFERAAATVEPASFLAQGTLYPDVVESGTRTAATIKTHHNVGGLPADMKFRLLEPFRLLFKDEVRAIGAELGLPEELVWRPPFPGPGLAIRIIGAVTPERLEILREADAIYREEIFRAGLHRSIWQYFAVLAPIRSVGVMGDQRTYAHPIILRAVTGEDAMTMDWARIPFDLLARISSRIVNETPGVNRVVYDITTKPPATIEWE
ncbi:MAG TPA: glutamine-hydrolyzing GMP synthase [Armatimonadota bacterium]|nr:glutamine-hydrolyzing GMP synthase [Armatimonadota bacterium]